MKSMCKYWGLHISTDTDRLGAVLGSFWAVWKGLLWCLKAKLRSWRFLRYWRFNKRYHGGYQLICLISWPILISSRRDWYRSKRSLQGLSVAIETVRIIKELVEIWPNEVCDRRPEVKHLIVWSAREIELLLEERAADLWDIRTIAWQKLVRVCKFC